MDPRIDDPGTLPRDGREHRLHPLSWLFVLLAQLKQFIVPLVVLLFAGRGDRNDLWGLIAVGVLVLVSLAEYFTYRYRLRGNGHIAADSRMTNGDTTLPLRSAPSVLM